MIRSSCFLALLFCLLVPVVLVANNDLNSFSDPTKLKRISSLSILEDTLGGLSVKDVLHSDAFVKAENDIPNLQVSTSTFWIRFEIRNETDKYEQAILLTAPTIDKASLYESTSAGSTKLIGAMGEHKPFSERKYNDPNYIFETEIPPGGTRTYLLKVKSNEQLMIPLSIGSRENVSALIADNNVIFGLYAGFILVMFFYNLFLYFIVRDNSYLYYITYLILIGLTQVSLKGYTYKYLWPDSAWLTHHSVVILSSLAAIAGMLFLRSFLQTRKHTPRLDRGLDVINAVFILSIILSLLGMETTSFKIMQLDTIVCSFYGLFVAYRISRKGYRPAKFFLLAWSILLGGAIVFVLKDFGVIPFNRYTDHILQLASALETILLSLALADRINILKQEKEEAQARELFERREKQDILEKQAEVLQVKVEEATQELRDKNVVMNETNKRLEDTLIKLKATQAELVQKQKMASLGQLAAGVAHEVNNPLNIINVSLDIIERDFKELQNCMDQFRSIELSSRDLHERLAAAHRYTEEEAEYGELLKEVEKAMERARRGVTRTAEIAQELRTFSRIDAAGFSHTQLNNDIDAMLNMMKYTIGDIRIEKEYGQLPKVSCHSQKLNQLFQNVLTNAVEAIDRKEMSRQEGLISILTKVENKEVVISFTDNGVGMTESVREQAFDPFYTTKGVAGKGLGLSNAYGTMEEHRGKIEIESEPGKGTTVTIHIPLT